MAQVSIYAGLVAQSMRLSRRHPFDLHLMCLGDKFEGLAILAWDNTYCTRPS
jgi:hypothetical protein